MKKNIIFLILCAVVSFWSCGDMHEKTKEYWGEVVYPGRFDTIIGKIGFERVEIDLVKAGRIPASQIKMGKAKKTVVEYDGKELVIDTLASWVNVTGLKQSKIYRFVVYTIDDFGNKSVPQEIALIPFTQMDLDDVVLNAPRVLASPYAASIEWASGLSSMLVDFYGLTFEYPNKSAGVTKGFRGPKVPDILVANIPSGQTTNVKVTYKIIPRYNYIPILDTCYIEKTIPVTTLTASGSFVPTSNLARDILRDNGLTDFNYSAAAAITKLTYRLDVFSLQDIWNFPNLKEIDMTGGSMYNIKTQSYNRNSATATIGGGKFEDSPFVACENIVMPQGHFIRGLIEAGLVTKVKYIEGTMNVDEALAPYFGTVVELIPAPSDAYITSNFYVPGQVQDNNFRTEVTWNPGDAPPGTGLVNVMKVIPKMRSSSLVFSLPSNFRFNSAAYKYFKYRIYSPPESQFFSNQSNFQHIWLRFMNYMWAFTSESGFGQELIDNNSGLGVPRPMHDLVGSHQQWKEYSIPISAVMDTRHTRVIVFNIGNERGVDPNADLVFYMSNFRFSKTR